MSEGFTKTEAALLEALERERALLKQRDLVNGIVLHEMSNAVAVVMGAVELIKLNGTRSPTFHFALQRVGGGARLMNEMLAGLRVLIGGEGNDPVYERRDLPAFLKSIATDPVLTAENAATRVEVRSRLGDPIAVFCPALVRHALANLVRNALRYSPPPRPVTVTVGSRRGHCWIHVLNRGPKIPPDIAVRLFEPGKKNPKGGMGFGLHISQACALRMGGELVFGTSPAATVFSLRLGNRASPVAPRPGRATLPGDTILAGKA
jgi:two-component system, OmpR family, sensor histidine kinase KdpD